MNEPTNPGNMNLAEIVRELNEISKIEILQILGMSAPARSFGFPYKDRVDMGDRKNQLYEELNKREEGYKRI